jgi:hypothetical protein
MNMQQIREKYSFFIVIILWVLRPVNVAFTLLIFILVFLLVCF